VANPFSDAFKRKARVPSVPLDYWTFRKLRSRMIKETGTKGWAEWFKYLARDVTLTPSLHEQVQLGTAQNLLDVWMLNYADNLPYIRGGKDVTVTIPKDYEQTTIADLITTPPLTEGEAEYKTADVPEVVQENVHVKYPPEGSAIVVGRGPSLFMNKHCEMLAKSDYSGLVICADGGLIPLLDAGVVPDFVVTVDGAPVIKKWFEHPLVQKFGPEMGWISSVTVNHEVFQTVRKAGMNIFWFNPIFDDWRQNESWTKLQVLMSTTDKYIRGVPRMSAGGNAGACAWIAALTLFHRSPIALIGIDFGYPKGTPLEQTQYYSSVLKIADNDVAKIKDAYKEFYHPVFKTDAYCDFIFYHYRQAFLDLQQTTPFWYHLFGGTVNCTQGGTLFGQGITNLKFEEFLEKWKK